MATKVDGMAQMTHLSHESEVAVGARRSGRGSGWLGALCALVTLVVLGSAPALAQDGSRAIERDLQRYWSGDREMPVIGGEKLYVTEGRFELAVFGGILPNDDFYTYFPVGLSVGYSFDGIWGLELSGSYVDLKVTSDLTDFLVAEGANIRPSVDLGDTQLGRLNLMATFSPLYGKWSFQTYKISHFDLFFALGGGVVFVEEPEIIGQDPAPDPVLQVLPEGVIGAGFRFFLTDWMDLRLDARVHLYPRFNGNADDPDARTVGAPTTITLGLGFLTPEL